MVKPNTNYILEESGVVKFVGHKLNSQICNAFGALVSASDLSVWSSTLKPLKSVVILSSHHWFSRGVPVDCVANSKKC